MASVHYIQVKRVLYVQTEPTLTSENSACLILVSRGSLVALREPTNSDHAPWWAWLPARSMYTASWTGEIDLAYMYIHGLRFVVSSETSLHLRLKQTQPSHTHTGGIAEPHLVIDNPSNPGHGGVDTFLLLVQRPFLHLVRKRAGVREHRAMLEGEVPTPWREQHTLIGQLESN